jgi:hypothetical protein
MLTKPQDILDCTHYHLSRWWRDVLEREHDDDDDDDDTTYRLLPNYWSAAAELGWLISDEDLILRGIPLEDMLVTREEYDETPDNDTDRKAADLLDIAIGLALFTIGWHSFTDEQGTSVYVHQANSRELAEGRWLMAEVIRSDCLLLRVMRGEEKLNEDEAFTDFRTFNRETFPRISTLAQEHDVLNSGHPMPQSSDSDYDDDDAEPTPWWVQLGWAGYLEWRKHHRDRPFQ